MGITWTEDQKKVIELRNRNILVSAAAGSGKTAVLVERIMEMVCDEAHPVDVDRLLVVTFTRAAAAEMKSRLSKALSECINERPDDANLLRQQLLLPRASIGTVDSFCGELVRQNFHKLDIPPQFRVRFFSKAATFPKRSLYQYLQASFCVFSPFQTPRAQYARFPFGYTPPYRTPLARICPRDTLFRRSRYRP